MDDAGRTALRQVGTELGGLVRPEPLSVPDHAGDTPGDALPWEPLDGALRPERLRQLVTEQQRRWSTTRPGVAASLLARELTGLVTTVAVVLWGRFHTALDLTSPNLLVACTPDDTRLALSVATARVAGDDPDALRQQLLAEVLDGTVAGVIDAVHEVARTGRRHLWGNVAAGIANTFTTISHTLAGADDERARFLGHRPELTRTIELVTVADDAGRPLTVGLRRNCCLLDAVDRSARCANCSLNDPEARRASVIAWYLEERRATAGLS